MVPRRNRVRWLLIAAGLLVLPSSLAAQEGLSHVRVVRLSYVHGTVAIKRPGASEWAKAMVNTPIQEGFSLSTSSDSYAEVQFENGSTARLGELSAIDFSQLALARDGNKLNRMTFTQGYATFHFVPEKGDVYAVRVANTTLTPRGKSEFRTDVNQNQLHVEVFNGAVEVEGPSGSTKLGKDKVLDYDTQAAQAFNIHEGIQKDSWDQWSEARDRQSTLAMNDAAVGLNRSLYGWSDLDAYGEWAYLPGYGYGWAPYEPLGWSPYSMGMWNSYPGFGWTWISGEPWGWLPFHYGSWGFDPTFGWFWMPGSFDAWSPALVTWYAGPGWVGWAPAGGGCQTGGNCVTAVPAGTIQNGQPVNSTSVLRPRPGEGRPMNAPPFQASRLAMLGGTPLPGNVRLPGMTATSGVQALGASRASGTGTESSAALRARSTPAPPTVLMGNNPETERGAVTAHRGFWGRAAQALGASEAQPLHARLGRTLGGHFPATGGAGEAAMGALRGPRGIEGGRMANRSMGRAAPRGFERSGPVMLPHGAARAASRGEGGGMMTGGSSGSGRSSGAVFSGALSSSVSVSSPSPSSGAGRGGSSGGSHH